VPNHSLVAGTKLGTVKLGALAEANVHWADSVSLRNHSGKPRDGEFKGVGCFPEYPSRWLGSRTFFFEIFRD
jgi:hypothetical protein